MLGKGGGVKLGAFFRHAASTGIRFKKVVLKRFNG
jgi:hypothetical protein